MAYDLTPVNYNTGATDPSTSFQQGVQTGDQLQTAQLKAQQIQYQQNQQQGYAKDVQQVMANGSQPGAIANLALKYPSMVEPIAKASTLLDTAQQNTRVQQATPIMAALYSNRPDIAAKKLNEQADAYQNAGRVDDANGARTMAQLVTQNPELAKFAFGVHLAGSMGAQNFATNLKQFDDTNKDQTLLPSQAAEAAGKAKVAAAEGAAAPTTVALKNADVSSQIAERAAKLGIEKDKLTTGVQEKLAELNAQYGYVPGGSGGTGNAETQKLVNDGVQKSVEAQTSAQRFEEMATQLESSNPAFLGKFGTFSEFLKQSTGNQNAVSALRAEYARIRGQGIAANLPPQIKRLTDSDLKIFGAGIPEDTAPPAQQAAFLRSIATIKQAEALNEDAKSQWAAANRTLGPARQDITIGGVTATKGTTLPEFTKQYVTQGITTYKQSQVNNEVNNSKLVQEHNAIVQGRSQPSAAPPTAAPGQPPPPASGTVPPGTPGLF